MLKTPQAVDQQQDNSLNVQTVQIGKLVASFLVPDYNEGQKLSVIDEGVLKYLKSLLPTASGRTIVKEFRDNLTNILHGENSGETMLAYAVSEAKDFIAFHTSINLLKQYFDPKMTVVREEPFNVAPEPMTLEQLYLQRNELEKQSMLLEEQIKNHPDRAKEKQVAVVPVDTVVSK